VTCSRFTAGDPFWLTCRGAYESSVDNAKRQDAPEGFGGDAFCYPTHDEHTVLHRFGVHSPPNMTTGCLNLLAGGDLDFDGTSYRPD
jgi:hypothetical protein